MKDTNPHTVDNRKKRAGEDAARAFITVASQSGPEASQSFISNYTNEHRTLQQSGGRLIFKLIEECAALYSADRYDHRNEAFYKWCHEQVEEGLPGLPYI